MVIPESCLKAEEGSSTHQLFKRLSSLYQPWLFRGRLGVQMLCAMSAILSLVWGVYVVVTNSCKLINSDLDPTCAEAGLSFTSYLFLFSFLLSSVHSFTFVFLILCFFSHAISCLPPSPAPSLPSSVCCCWSGKWPHGLNMHWGLPGLKPFI